MSERMSIGLFSTFVVVLGIGASTVRCGEPVAPAPEVPAFSPDIVAMIHHLREAAGHLTQVGKQELAEQLMAEAKRLATEQPVANAEVATAEVAKAEGLRGNVPPEIQPMQSGTGLVRQVLLRLTLIECQLDEQLPNVASILAKMDKVAGREAPAGDSGTCRVFDSAEAVDAVFADLRGGRQGKVLAEPILVTTSDRPASLRVGREIQLPTPADGSGGPVQFHNVGTSVDVLPKVQPDGSVCLELRLEHSEIDRSRCVTIGEKSVPGLRIRSLDTTLATKGGQTCVLSGLVQLPGSNEQPANRPTVLLLSVTTELVESLVHMPSVSVRR